MSVIRFPADGRSGSQRIVSQIEDAILDGVLRPGYELPLRAIADLNGLRWEPFLVRFRRLIDERIVLLRGDTAIVPSLNADEVIRLSELRISMWQHLAERISDRLSPAAITRMEGALHAVDPDRVGPIDHAVWVSVVIDVNKELLKALPTRAERETIMDLEKQTRRYCPLGWQIIHAESSGSAEATTRAMQRACLDNFYEELDGYRDGRRRIVLSAAYPSEWDRHSIAQASLTPENTRPALWIG